MKAPPAREATCRPSLPTEDNRGVVFPFLLLLVVACLAVAHPVFAEPQRIISLAPSVTETLFALGVGDRVVGVSVYCDYPPEATKIDRVGNFLTPNVEAIVAKKPDLIIAVPSPGNQNPVETLRRLGFEVLLVDPNTIAQIETSIVTIAAAIGRDAAGAALVASIEQRLTALRDRLATAPQRKVLMVVGQTPLIAVGAGTFQDEFIRMAHGVNLGAEAGGSWPHVSIELVIAAAPEVIIDTTMGNEERTGSGASLEFWSAFPTLPAVQRRRVYGYKQYHLLRPGPRLPEAFEAIARFVQPEFFESADGRSLEK
ncbi:MAG TPA: cobalamin-binding protein [Candidatus Acidoferrales bacterium]|nr:cobalamin-binding protein [Candidatus Acidoferrales bacterium]